MENKVISNGNRGWQGNNWNNRNNGYQNNSNGNQLKKKEADNEFFSKIEKDFAGVAEDVILSLDRNGDNLVLKTNQIRNVLDLINNVSEKIALHNDSNIEVFKDDISYIRVKLAYIYGKSKPKKDKNDDGVKDFIDKSKLIELTLCIGNSKQKYQIFAKYVEALVAFHKYYGGRDN